MACELGYTGNHDLRAWQCCQQIAQHLRANPQAWTQGVYARDHDGGATNPTGRRVTSACMLGLVIRAARTPELRRHILLGLELLVGPLHVPAWNDAPERTVAQVISLFEEGARHFRNAAQPRVPRVPDWNAMAMVPFETLMKKIEMEAA